MHLIASLRLCVSVVIYLSLSGSALAIDSLTACINASRSLKSFGSIGG